MQRLIKKKPLVQKEGVLKNKSSIEQEELD